MKKIVPVLLLLLTACSTTVKIEKTKQDGIWTAVRSEKISEQKEKVKTITVLNQRAKPVKVIVYLWLEDRLVDSSKTVVDPLNVAIFEFFKLVDDVDIHYAGRR